MLRRGIVRRRCGRPLLLSPPSTTAAAAAAPLAEQPSSATALPIVVPRRQASSSETINAAAANIGRRGRHTMLLQRHQQRTISSTMPRSRHADNGKEASPSSLVPPATWSIHDLQLLKEDAGQGGEEGLSQDELTRLAGYAHVSVGVGDERAQGKLREDLGAIIRCMTLLQKADLGGVSREEMYAPPPHASSATPLREDVVTEGGPEQQRRLLALSGETARRSFVVPTTVVDKA